MKIRIISGTVGAALLILIFFFLFTPVLNVALSLLSVIAVYEMAKVTKSAKSVPLLATGLIYAAVLPLSPLVLHLKTLLVMPVLYIFAVMTVALANNAKMKLMSVISSFAIFLPIPAAFTMTIYLRDLYKTDTLPIESGFLFMFLACSGAFVSDSGAYFTGVFFGKRKLAPEISPKKTVEGAAGGILFNMLAYIIIAVIWQKSSSVENVQINFLYLIITALLCTIISIIGDLSFSLIKRICLVKDYGNIMPGHGGVLDRFDSMLFTVPFLYVFLQILPIIKITA